VADDELGHDRGGSGGAFLEDVGVDGAGDDDAGVAEELRDDLARLALKSPCGLW
jgi:hypothetical protein